MQYCEWKNFIQRDHMQDISQLHGLVANFHSDSDEYLEFHNSTGY